MILVRLVFQAKFGKVNEAMTGFKQGQQQIQALVEPNARSRLLTDLSGPFHTIVQEIEVESLAEWGRLRSAIFLDPQFQQAAAVAANLFQSGRTEFYTIEV